MIELSPHMEATIRAAGILMAAGRSTRMQGGPKLLRQFRGKPLARWMAEALVEAGLSPIVVVLGAEASRVRLALSDLPVRFVENPRFAEGMASSLAAGISFLGPDVGLVAVSLADMPLVRPDLVKRLVAELSRSGKTIAVPHYEGRRGHPVLFDLRRHRTSLLALSGDQGARALLAAHPDEVLEVSSDDGAILQDIDTAHDLQALDNVPLNAGAAVSEPGPLFDDRTVLEINSLWEPVYPFMVEHLLAVSRVTSGRFLDLGPFSGGLALNVLWKSEAFLATVIDRSAAVLRWVEERAAEGGYVSRLTTRQLAVGPIGEPSDAFDLVAVRGAFFFLTPDLLREVWRVLAPGGFGWVGGGFGPRTPPEIIAPLADLSRDLNASLGKRRVSELEARQLVATAGLEGCAVVSTAGGLWIEVRK